MTTPRKTKPKPPPLPKVIETPAAMVGLLSVRQVAIGLGGLHRSAVYKLVKQGKFPKPDCQIGEKLPRWSVRLFNRWVEEQIEKSRSGELAQTG